MILSGKEIIKRGYVEGLYSEEEQVQPHGIDLSIEGLYLPITLPITEKITDRHYYKTGPIIHDKGGEIYLVSPRRYLVRINETINLHGKYGAVVGYALPKSSWSRRGIIIHSALWDFGYRGRGMLLVDFNIPMELDITKNIRFAQLVIMEAQETEETYKGNYQQEGIEDEEQDD